MRFIIMAQAGSDKPEPDAGGGLDEALLTAYMRFNEEMHQAGVLVASEGLNPAARGARIAVSKGKRYVVDGPFAESKELVGGFYIVEVGSLGGDFLGPARALRPRLGRCAGGAPADRRGRRTAGSPRHHQEGGADLERLGLAGARVKCGQALPCRPRASSSP